MAARFFYLLVTVFFITMNVLLWRADVAGRADFGSRLSPRLVWEKVLTAAGESTLEIRYKGRKVGTARWQPSIGASTGRKEPNSELPEGMIEGVTSYQLEFDGSCVLDEFTRVRFGLHLRLGTNYQWQEISVRLAMRPHLVEVRARAAEQVLRVRIEDEDGPRERSYKFSDLRNPDKLLAELDQAWLPGALLALGLPLSQRSAESALGSFKWQARNDVLKVQHVPIRGYRLQTRVLDRHVISIFINPAGEILRIDFPGEIVLLSDSLTNL